MKLRLLVPLLLLLGCGDTGQPSIQHAAVGVGTAAHAFDSGDYLVTLDVARIGFGPAVFCASRAASDEQCPAAVAELASVAAFDALSAAPQPLGTVHGFVGTIRSAGFGYGITWLPTQTSAQAGSAAPNGHSAHLEGSATHKTSGASFRFVADVDVKPLRRGGHALTAPNLDASIDERTVRLEVRIDPTAYLAQVNFNELAALGSPTVTITPGSGAYNALVVGMTTLAPPQFAWSR